VLTLATPVAAQELESPIPSEDAVESTAHVIILYDSPDEYAPSPEWTLKVDAFFQAVEQHESTYMFGQSEYPGWVLNSGTVISVTAHLPIDDLLSFLQSQLEEAGLAGQSHLRAGPWVAPDTSQWE
jgi:hypothetical protein